MTEKEELIFGLKRWLNKIIKYLDNRSAEDFFKDERSFDASLYCVSVISEIASRISKFPDLVQKYDDIEFDELALLNDSILKGDNFDLNYIYGLFNEAFPYLLFLLIEKDKENK